MVLVALVPTTKHLNTRFSLAAATLNLLAAFAIVLLAHIEHVKSIRPSFLLTAYLFVSLLFDAARLRTEWLMLLNLSYAATLSTSTVFKLAVLVLETIEKRKILITADHVPSKESTSGPFSRGFFVWLNSLLFSGWATVLTNNDLPTIYEKLSSEKLALRFGKAWQKGKLPGRLCNRGLTYFSNSEKQEAFLVFHHHPGPEMGTSQHHAAPACHDCS